MTAPLAGLTVIVARDDAPDDDLSVAIAAAGAVVVPLPLMRIVPVADPGSLHAVVDRCGPGAIVAFTSRHAVAVVATRPAPPGVTVAAVGSATARALHAAGWPVHVVGDGGGAALAARLVVDPGVAGRRVLWPHAEDAHGALKDALAAAGAVVDELVAYHAVPVADVTGVATALASVRPLALVVTSPRRARLLGEVGTLPADVAVVAIGSTTSDACRNAGIAVAATATSPAAGPVCAALAALHTPH